VPPELGPALVPEPALDEAPDDELPAEDAPRDPLEEALAGVVLVVVVGVVAGPAALTAGEFGIVSWAPPVLSVALVPPPQAAIAIAAVPAATSDTRRRGLTARSTPTREALSERAVPSACRSGDSRSGPWE
jgi:hypothetical protein